MLEQGFDNMLRIGNLLLELSLFTLKFHCEIADFFFFLIKNLELLSILSFFLSSIACQVILNVFDRLVVSLNNFACISNFFLLHLDLGIVLLDAVHQTFTGLWERKIHLVGLQFKVFLPLGKLGLLIAQVLRALFEGVGAEAGFSLSQAAVDIFEVLTLAIDISLEGLILTFEAVVLVALLRVEIV